MVDDIQHSPFTFRSSYFATEGKPGSLAWFILGRSQAGYSKSPPSYAYKCFPHADARSEADQPVVLCIVLLADECKIWLSAVFRVPTQSHGLSKMTVAFVPIVVLP